MTLFHLWDLPGDVLAAPELASGLDRCNISLSMLMSGCVELRWAGPFWVIAWPAACVCAVDVSITRRQTV